ncbi:MAG: glycosyltransferase [Clostridia bacterium]|nr:glycosyltransferase [Clostridia bacterium]
MKKRKPVYKVPSAKKLKNSLSRGIKKRLKPTKKRSPHKKAPSCQFKSRIIKNLVSKIKQLKKKLLKIKKISVNNQTVPVNNQTVPPPINYLENLLQSNVNEKDFTTVDIIIPIYNAVEYIKTCIKSVLNNTNIPYTLNLIDDCSTDEKVVDYLEELRLLKQKPDNLKNISIIRNNQNIGFIQSINKGLELTSNHVVILNSDTEVPKEWLSRLIKPIMRNNTIASVTPFSNSAEICSFPLIGQDNKLPENLTLDELNDVFSQYGQDIPVEIPTGIGFCLAMNRNTIHDIGFFDANLFEKGYGEENDWCLRAEQAGYKNVLIPNLFVYHKHGASFNQISSDIKQNLMMKHLSIIEAKFPGYNRRIQEFYENDPIRPIRSILNSAVTARTTKREGLLIITNTLGGGSQLFYEYCMKSLQQEKRLYVMTFQEGQLYIVDHNTIEPVTYVLDISYTTVEKFKKLLELFFIHHVFINHLINYPVYTMLKLIEQCGIEYSYFIHDYFAVCPNCHLMNREGVYCNVETTLSKCRECISTNLRNETIIKVSSSPIDIDLWRFKFTSFLRNANQIIAPSTCARDIINKYYPNINIEVREHRICWPVEYTFQEQFVNEEQIKIAFIGAIGQEKGSLIIYGLEDEIRKRQLPIRLKVIGYTDFHCTTCTSEDGILHITGKYQNNNISELLALHHVAIVVIASVVPETYSYTTSEALLSGYPVITFDLGAPAERMRRTGVGWILSERTVSSILHLLETLLSNREEILYKAHLLSKLLKTNRLP